MYLRIPQKLPLAPDTNQAPGLTQEVGIGGDVPVEQPGHNESHHIPLVRRWRSRSIAREMASSRS
jgi:hypothetical protein